MGLSFNTRHYTYHTGSASDLAEAPSIVTLFRPDIEEWTGARLSLQGATQFYEKAVQVVGTGPGGSYPGWLSVLPRKQSGPRAGEYEVTPNYSRTPRIKFDTILYLSSTSEVLGYTLFGSPQTNEAHGATVKDVWIRTGFEVSGEGIEWNPVFSVAKVFESGRSGRELYPGLRRDFLTPSDPEVGRARDPRTDYVRYSRFPADAGSVVRTGTGAIYAGQPWSLSGSPGIPAPTGGTWWPCLWGSRIVVSVWSEGKVRLYDWGSPGYFGDSPVLSEYSADTEPTELVGSLMRDQAGAWTDLRTGRPIEGGIPDPWSIDGYGPLRTPDLVPGWSIVSVRGPWIGKRRPGDTRVTWETYGGVRGTGEPFSERACLRVVPGEGVAVGLASPVVPFKPVTDQDRLFYDSLRRRAALPDYSVLTKAKCLRGLVFYVSNNMIRLL